MKAPVQITFQPQNITVPVPDGSTVLEAAFSAGVVIDSVCGGKGRCGKCRVEILSGDAGKLTEREQHFLSFEEIQKGLRLACQTRVQKGMEIYVGPTALDLGLRGKDIKGMALTGFESRINKKYFELNPPSEKDQASNLERIGRAFPSGKNPGLEVLRKIGQVLPAAQFKVTLTCRGNELLKVEPGDRTAENYGLAVDLGSTTVAGYLLDLNSGRILASEAALNKQSHFGADVISRINFAIEHPEGLTALQKRAAETINKLLDGLLANNKDLWENIHLVTLVGNPTMMHLFLGLNPRGLASFPFTTVFSDLLALPAQETGIRLPGHTRLEVLPLVSAYVGADLVAAALAVGLDEPGTPRLLLDIGTNGEIALAVGDRIWACSTAAGPALEGGGIKFGMRAEPGAISAVDMSDGLKLVIIGRGPARGLCGSGLLDAVAQLLEQGLITRTGRLKEIGDLPENVFPTMKSRLISREKGRIFKLTSKVYLNQNDITQLQLAKGAMRAGIEILMAEAGIKAEELDEVLLAGAFGASLKAESLLSVGLLPALSAKKVRPVGNAAGWGAVLCLLSEQHHQRAIALARHIEYLELSLNPDFEKKFIDGIKFDVI